MKRPAAILLSFLLLSVRGESVYAQLPTVTLSLRYFQSYDFDFNPLGMSLVDAIGPTNPVLTTDIHEFAVEMRVDGLHSVIGGEDLQSVQFDIVTGLGLQPETFAEFGKNQAYFESVILVFDPPHPGAPVPAWDENEDTGVDPADLQEIVVLSNSHNQAIRFFEPGEHAPLELGRFYLNLTDTVTDSYVTIVPHGDPAWSIWSDADSVPQPASTLHVGAPFVIRVVPEPPGVFLMIAATLWSATLRRRFGIARQLTRNPVAAFGRADSAVD